MTETQILSCFCGGIFWFCTVIGLFLFVRYLHFGGGRGGGGRK